MKIDFYKLLSALSLLFIALSVVYYFIYRPYNKDQMQKQCYKWAVDQSASYGGAVKEDKREEIYKKCLQEYAL